MRFFLHLLLDLNSPDLLDIIDKEAMMRYNERQFRAYNVFGKMNVKQKDTKKLAAVYNSK